MSLVIANASETTRFISATPQTTWLADGKPLPEKIESIGWSWHPDQGNSGVFESVTDQQRKTATLLVKAAGLEAGAVYEVFGYFWANDASLESTASHPHHAVQFGLSLATMHPFDGERPDTLVSKEPWVITPGYKTGQAYGYQAIVEERYPLPGLDGINTTQGNSRLIRARLGCSRAGKDGTLPVFFSPNDGSRSVSSARIDGIALRRAAPDASPDQGRKPGTHLHLAIRAGDPITIRRELEAGADVNAFDEENLTPLFYAAACGNAALVHDLLVHGAKPNQPAQSVSPLTAAATISDPEIVQLLLDAGAEVPTSPPKSKGALAGDIDPRILHPVVASIRSGSVPVLKMLLVANKDISLPKFEEALRHMGEEQKPKLKIIYLADEAMLQMDWDMAAFLIDHGVSITCKEFASYTDPAGRLLARAVHSGPDAMPVVEAMLRRGEPVVTNANFRSGDALNAATMRGNGELVRRFLPYANNVGEYYQTGLMENALFSADEEIIGLIRNRFPDAKVSRWQPEAVAKNAVALEDPAKRWFLPRTSPPQPESPDTAKGKHVLAVISAPDASDVGDVLSAHASQENGWQVVERAQIEAALGEGRFSKPWLDGEHRLSELGDRLTADCLIVVSTIHVGKESIHRFEVVEVATGLEIHREHFKGNAFVDKKEVSDFLSRAAHALDAAGRNERHQAITLLTFSTRGRVGNPLTDSGLLRAAVQHEVDSTPGLISLSRAQSSRLVEEQALDGKNSVWGAAHMIEGVVAADGETGIKVTLRLETYKDGTTTKTDAEAVGVATAIAETTAAAWKKLMADSGNQIAVSNDQPPETGRSLNEGRRLMREADWLHSLDANPASYLPLIESAVALGVPAEETILLHLDAHFRNFSCLYTKNYGAREGDYTTALQHLPDQSRSHASLALSDQLAYQIPIARNFLHQTSWYLEHQGAAGLDGGTDLFQLYGPYKYNEIWYAIQALSAIRLIIYPEQIADHLTKEYETFAAELDDLTRRYFSVLQTVPDPDPYRYYVQISDSRLYKKNPALAEGLAEMAATGAALTVLMPSRGMESRKNLARKMIEKISNNPSPRARLAKADLECFLADRTQRPHAIRRLAEASAEARWHTTPTRDESGSYLLSQAILNSCTTSYLLDKTTDSGSLEHNGSLLPSLLFSAKSAPDLLIRFNTYHEVFHVINQREAWKLNETHSTIDTFRESILAYDSFELRRLKAESSSKKPVNGIPPRTTLRHGPPGFAVTPKSRNLLAVIGGTGKGKEKTEKSEEAEKPEKSEKPPTKTPKPIAPKATLLADLRTSKSPGTIIWPLVDNVDSNLLWVFYFPSASDHIRVNQAGGGGAQTYRYVCTAPWLLGINCRDGSIVRKVNLHAAVGEAYGMDLSNRKCQVWGMCLDQTKNHILTSVGWYDENHSGNKMGSVIIDKKTGKAHPIPRNPAISQGEGNLVLDLWDRNNGVAAVGEHFFYLDKAGEWTGGAIEGVRSNGLAVFQVFPDFSVKPLTMMGRRPELTPFDVQNRAPISITSHGNRLIVIHPSTIAEYDPVANDWSITASLPSERPTNKHTNTVADAQYWDYLRSLNELRVDGDSTGWIAVSWWHPPGILPFASRTKGWRNIPIHTGIPDDFLQTTFAMEEIRSNQGDGGEKKSLFKDHPQFKKSNIVVLAQTDTDLILGTQTSDNYEWKHPSRNTHHLPFLWKISKQEILSYLNHE